MPIFTDSENLREQPFGGGWSQLEVMMAEEKSC
jgi:hypothetical protein